MILVTIATVTKCQFIHKRSGGWVSSSVNIADHLDRGFSMIIRLNFGTRFSMFKSQVKSLVYQVYRVKSCHGYEVTIVRIGEERESSSIVVNLLSNVAYRTQHVGSIGDACYEG